MTLSVVPCHVREQWDSAVNSQQGHPMQLWGWGETKAAHNWSVDRVMVRDASGELVGSAQILLRKLPFPFRSLAYLARGPQAAAGREIEVLAAVAHHVKAVHKSVALSMEPDWDEAAVSTASLPAAGWRRSESTILIPRTLILDLGRSEDELLAAMSKKTRQYIRKSGREALEYRAVTAAELPACLAVYKETAQRAGFGIHADAYYLDIFSNLGEGSPVYGAFDGDSVVSFLWLAASDSTAFELYGGMTDAGSNLRANFSLKWLAIQEMKARGITRYDFNGLLNDGVSKFKFGFADHENMLAGTWDKGLSPLYPVFAKALPLARKAAKKARGLLKR
ncbi:methicillin resistance protein [Arthrobacter livingstonensis]|uniref:Methicillin resistance protein n=1 Tax=Arthrobacter livingstonensis TaxID=670078 RepID=A0A2V5LA23_9MICC|nr:peptidoglycan bridge formation glycyltransferase FemA/FemB family protein [Arthrobacter livingstonensis]PYI68415.1 methicillin resistance protein [Arthrobacter livingstonensis]